MSSDIPFRIRNFTAQQRKRAGELGNAFTGPAAGRNYFHANGNLTITRDQMRYAFRVTDTTGMYHFDGIRASAEAVVEWLRTAESLSYCIWGARPDSVTDAHMERQSGLIFNENKEEDGNHSVSALTHFCQEILHEYTTEMENLKLDVDQNMFIACAWITNKERRMFRLFPHVLKIDVTKGTNRENRPLMTVSMRTAYGKYLVIMRMFLSNERRTTFRWVFCIAFPTLLGTQWIARVKAIVTDGDSHEIEELEELMRRYMPHCIRIRCGWHIIFKGWSRQCSIEGAIPREYKRTYRQFATTVKKWCYSFMYPRYCESEHELHISKCLLLAFVYSRPVRTFLTPQLRKVIHNFLIGYVFVHDRHLCFHYRKGICYYEESTNSSHEGTNLGLKEHSAPVLANRTVAFNAAMLKLQSDMAIDEQMHRASSSVEATATWTNRLPANGFVTELCLDLATKSWNFGKNYSVRRAPVPFSPWQWHVVISDPSIVNNEKKHLLPVWHRTRCVHLNKMGRLECTCMSFEQRGIPCAHQAAVLMHEYPSYKGFTHHDVSIVWWKKHVFLGLRDGNNNVDECIQHLLDNDISGPKFPLPLQNIDGWTEGPYNTGDNPIKFKHLHVDPKSSCVNYTEDQILRAINTFGGSLVSNATATTTTTRETEICPDPGYLSQECFVTNDDITNNAYTTQMPAFPSFTDGQGTYDAHFSTQESEENEIFLQAIEEEAGEQMTTQQFISCIREEVSELQDLFRSGNYVASDHNLLSHLESFRQLRRDIRRKMAERGHHNQGQEWVSANAEQTQHKRRFRGATLGLTSFT